MNACPAVVVEDLCRTFAGPPQVHAVHPCSFVIERGEYVSVTGPSGSGKTTLLAMLGLLDRPTGGRYLLDGLEVARLDDARAAAARAHLIGFVFQAFHLIPHRTVTDNIELGLLYKGVSRRRRRELARQALAEVGLLGRAQALCGELSGGERQRVAIARAIVRRPALVLCDEPSGNLDRAATEGVLDAIGSLNEAGMTIVVVTHDPTVARRAARSLHITDGRVEEVQH